VAGKKEEIARRIAEEERLKAEKAKESETIALKLAENAENLKKIALKNEAQARKAEVNALKVANFLKAHPRVESVTYPSLNDPLTKERAEKSLCPLIELILMF